MIRDLSTTPSPLLALLGHSWQWNTNNSSNWHWGLASWAPKAWAASLCPWNHPWGCFAPLQGTICCPCAVPPLSQRSWLFADLFDYSWAHCLVLERISLPTGLHYKPLTAHAHTTDPFTNLHHTHSLSFFPYNFSYHVSCSVPSFTSDVLHSACLFQGRGAESHTMQKQTYCALQKSHKIFSYFLFIPA